jgi:hypothetical protein
MPDWLDLTQIFLQLAACYACYLWGKQTGIGDTIEVLLDRKILKESDLDKLTD